MREAPVRTIRKLDRRPGEPPLETRTVAGYVIERDVPLPRPASSKSPLVIALLALEVGESIVHDLRPQSAITSKTVAATGRKFTARQLPDGKYRIWRTD